MAELLLQDISKSFGKKQVLKYISCRLGSGITALLGPNGAGKSTLMNIICGLMQSDSGAVYYDGAAIQTQKEAYLEKISIQFQNQPMYKSDTALEYLAFCGALKGLPKETTLEHGKQLLQRFGIAETGKKKISAFSGGMRQRLALCGTFLGSPEIILLDEPSAGLDIYEREELKRYLCELKKNRIIIISTHIVSDIENIADNIVLLTGGNIFATGTQQSLIDDIDGTVWEIPSDAEFQGRSYYSDGKHLTFSQESPCPDALPKQADLTDVYFSCVKVR